MKTPRYFTPRTKTERLKLVLSEADRAKIGRGRPWQAEVTDLQTGKRYHVEGAACGGDSCFCDATAVEIAS